MSASTHPTPDYQCSHCEDEFDVTDAYRGSFCSPDCYQRHKGESVLRNIAGDHRWCATCFRQIKSVERPTAAFVDQLQGDETKASVVGFQYETPHTERAVDEFGGDGTATRPVERSRWGCECGAVDPSTRTEVLCRVETATTIASLWACLCDLWTEDNVAHRPSRADYFAALRDGDDLDWSRAIGAAIYGD